MKDLNSIIDRGLVFIRDGLLNEALQCFDEVIEKNANMAEAWGHKGYVLYKMKRFKEAEKCHDKALELNPNLIHSWINKGQILSAIGKKNKGAATINKALKINPESSELWEQKAFYLAPKSKAMACADKAISLNPNSPIAYAVKAIIVYFKHKLNTAFEYVEKALEISPTQEYALYVKSMLQSHRDVQEKALGELYTYSDCENCGMRVKSGSEIDGLSDNYCNRCGIQLNYDIHKDNQRGEIDLTKYDRSIYQFCTVCGTPNPKEAKKCKNCKLSLYSAF